MISTERLRSILEYNAETGVFRRKIRAAKMDVGSVVGARHSQDYLYARIENRLMFMHRVAWQYVYGSPPVGEIDHINGDRSDNRICNLRLSNRQQNSANTKRRYNNRAGAKGVVIDKRNGSIRAYIHVNSKTKYLGTFETIKDASSAYLKAAKEHFLDFARAE